MQTASETAQSTNRLSLISTRARTAWETAPSLQVRGRGEEKGGRGREVEPNQLNASGCDGKSLKRGTLTLLTDPGDWELVRAPWTSRAQVKFTTRKKTLMHRKKRRSGILERK